MIVKRIKGWRIFLAKFSIIIFAKNTVTIKFSNKVWNYIHKKRQRTVMYIYGGRCGINVAVFKHIAIVIGGMGTVAWRPLEFDERGICDLGFYYATQKRSGKTAPIHERAKGERRWSGSRNLVRPVERTNVTRYSRKALEEIADSGNPHEIFSKRYPGYWLSEFPSIRWNDVNKSWYLDAVLYRPDSDNLAEYARKDDSEIRGRRRKAGG